MVEQHLNNININKPFTLYQPLEIDRQDNNYVSFNSEINKNILTYFQEQIINVINMLLVNYLNCSCKIYN